MEIIGTVESLWRYPVKSMRGEEVEEFFAGFAGVYGDRLFAFRSSALTSSEGFAEDGFVGHRVRLGGSVTVSILQRDSRCMIITLDPDTAEKNPAVLKQVAQAHGGMIGIYGATLVEGIVRKGDPVELLD